MQLGERFWSKVNKDTESGCWEWTASLQTDGYGQFSIKVDDHHRTVQSHRLTYEALVGDIPDGLQIDHLCRNASCVNPEHLEPVSALENISRSPIHNGAKTHCPQGHPFDKANTYIRNGRWRGCRACAKAYQKTYQRERTRKILS
jgi:hypothetical protein